MATLTPQQRTALIALLMMVRDAALIALVLLLLQWGPGWLVAALTTGAAEKITPVHFGREAA